MAEYIHIQFTHTYSDAMSRAKDMTTTIPSNTSNLCVKYFIRNAISFNRTYEVRARSHDKRLWVVKGLKWSHDKGLVVVKGLKWSHDERLLVVKGLKWVTCTIKRVCW